MRNNEATISDVITRMVEIKSAIDSLPKFRGRAALIAKVHKHIRFMTLYKTDRKLGLLLLGDCEEALDKANKIFEKTGD
uniref:Uncharacterized protein n=1 Tax=viral metagenome TaxID=1070528 RepID=A0A6H2A5U3_9ZZZZ